MVIHHIRIGVGGQDDETFRNAVGFPCTLVQGLGKPRQVYQIRAGEAEQILILFAAPRYRFPFIKPGGGY